jgi:hypothetical protein
MKIVVDLDGPGYEWDKTARYMLRTYRGCTGLDAPSREWLLPNQAWHNVTDEDWDWLWSDGVELGLFRYGHVTRGAIVGLRSLSESGHDLVVGTHRPVGAVRDTLAWLSYINIDWTDVHILSNEEPKTQIDGDLLIDDKPENIVQWSMSGRKAILFDRAWNKGHSLWNLGGQWWRREDWEGVVDLVADMDAASYGRSPDPLMARYETR